MTFTNCNLCYYLDSILWIVTVLFWEMFCCMKATGEIGKAVKWTPENVTGIPILIMFECAFFYIKYRVWVYCDSVHELWFLYKFMKINIYMFNIVCIIVLYTRYVHANETYYIISCKYEHDLFYCYCIVQMHTLDDLCKWTVWIHYNVLILYTHIHWITLSTQLSAVIVNEGYILII